MATGGVYLIKCPYDGVDMLKIGMSKDVLKRVKSHLASNPLAEVIGYIESPDYKWLEKDVHHKCRNHRYKLEWFYCKDVIIEFFKSHPDFKEA